MAKQKQRYSAAQKGAITVGLALTLLDAYGAFQYASKLEGGAVNYLVLAAPLVALAACTLPFFAERAWQEGRHWKAVLLLLAFTPAAGFVVQTALERVATAQDQVRSTRQNANRPVALAREALKAAEKELDDAKADRKAECDDGPGAKCRDKKGEEEKARKRVSDARTTLASAGVEVGADPAATALQAMVPFLTVETVELYRPAVLPVTLLIVGFTLIAYGASQGRDKKPEKVKAKAPRRKAAKTRKAAVQTEAMGNVIPFPRAANEN